MQFLEDLKKFSAQLKAEHEEADLESRVENYGLLMGVAILALLVLAVVVGLLTLIIGKLLPFIIAVAIGVGAYVWFKKK